MEWTTVTVIVALAGLCATLIKPIVALTKAITKLDMSVDRVNEKFDEFSDRNRKAHDTLFSTQREHESRLDDQERRIVRIEAKES